MAWPTNVKFKILIGQSVCTHPNTHSAVCKHKLARGGGLEACPPRKLKLGVLSLLLFIVFIFHFTTRLTTISVARC